MCQGLNHEGRAITVVLCEGREIVWTALLAPELDHLELEGGTNYSAGPGELNVYTTNTTNILMMVHGLERIKQSRLVSLSVTNIEQDLLPSITRLCLYPKVRTSLKASSYE